MIIKDKQLDSYISKYEIERQTNPNRKIGDKTTDLDEILTAIADKGGRTGKKIKEAIANAPDLDAKIKYAAQGLSATEKADLEQIRKTCQLSAAAQQAFNKILGNVTPTPNPGPSPTPGSDIFEVVIGSPLHLKDDKVKFAKDGTVTCDTGLKAFSRGYLKTKDGVLRTQHGSNTPATITLTQAERAAMDKACPGKGLDIMARECGVTGLGFAAMATHPDFFDSTEPEWAGKCETWSWTSLHKADPKQKKEMRSLVDMIEVDGSPGERGLWFKGQWMSRADLGNWLMGTGYYLSQAATDSIYLSPVDPDSLIKVIGQYLKDNGNGFVADVFNNARNGANETWNQPFVGHTTTVSTVSGQAAAGVLAQAVKDGVKGVGVKLVTLTGKYGDEKDDGHEDATCLAERKWATYVVVDANGEMLKAYMADDSSLSSITGLPTTKSDELPDMIRKPSMKIINEVIAGKENWDVENQKYGPEFKFFVNKFLMNGVSGAKRKAFEADVARINGTSIDAATASRLATQYPGIANAYSNAEWQKHFASRGLVAKDFGAI